MKILFSQRSKAAIITILAAFIIFSNCFSQDFIYADLTWEDEVTPYNLPEELVEENSILTKYHNYVQFNPEYDSEYRQLNVEHYKVYINSDQAIEENNKIYVPRQTVDNKYNEINIRVIQPNGSVKELDESNIKIGTDEDSGLEYSYYAIEGLKIGSEIEALIKTQISPRLYGRMYFLQRTYPMFDYHFEYIAPAHLEMGFKTYNTERQFEVNRTDENTTYVIHIDEAEKYEPEVLSNRNSNKEYFIFKLDKNKANDKKDINGFGYYSQIVGKRCLVSDVTKSEKKSLDKIYNKIEIKEGASERDKVLSIENYLKQNFIFIENPGEASLNTISSILSQKAYNVVGALRLYNELLSRANLTTQIIVTCDKTEVNFDSDFENYLFLSEYLINVPEAGVVLSPKNQYSRLQYFNSAYQGHPGLYIKARTIGSTTTALGKVQMIPSTGGKESTYKVLIDVDIEDEFDDVSIAIESFRTGHMAKNFQPLFSEVEEENFDKFCEYAMYTYDTHVKVETIETENIEVGDFPNKPLIMRAELESEGFFEKAGANYFLSVGALIGPQSQLYNEDESSRKAAINSQYARRFQYEISFNIPEGYEAKNLEDLSMNVDGTNDEYTYYFKSSYEVEGSQVKVSIDELYNHDYYTSDQFPTYLKVINAAADFNKLKVIFNPK